MTGRHRLPVRRKRNTETSEYVAYLMRIIIGYGVRIGSDPVALIHLRDIENVTRDAVNAGIYLANHTGERPYSINEIAAIMHCSIGNSKSQLHKARMRLRQLLQETERARAREQRQAAKAEGER